MPPAHAPRELPDEPVLDLLRRQIVEGRFAPGQRLPRRTDLIDQLGVCNSTLQKAQDTLKREGFIEASRRHGTFVTAHPPHLFHVGLTFDSNATLGRWAQRTRFLFSLEQEAAAISRQGPWRIVPFTDTHPDSGEACQRLREHLRDGRLAGLIVTNPYAIEGLVRGSGIPSVGFSGTTDPPTTLRLRLDPGRFIDRALDDLRARGRRRVALMASSTAPLTKLDHFLRAAAARRMRALEPWVQGVSLREPHWARQTARLMFMGKPADRPDSLIISDEHLMEHALAGLGDEGLRIGRDVEVIAHANFHASLPSPLPVRRLGYVTRDLLLKSIELIDHANRGKPAAAPVEIDPQFESEIPPRPAALGDAEGEGDAVLAGDLGQPSPRRSS